MTPNFRTFLALLALASLCAWGVSHAQVTNTRVTPYDWQCQDGQGNRISDHQREGTAIVACLNAPNGAFVQGGRYRITRQVVTNGQAVLRWTPPTQCANNTPITNCPVTAYRIVYGRAADQLTEAVQIAPASTHTLTGLAPGTWYFAVIAVSGTPSALSNIASKAVS